MQPTRGAVTVSLHSTDCIHFLIICLMDGILKRSFANLVPQGTNNTSGILLETEAKAPRFEAPHHWLNQQ